MSSGRSGGTDQGQARPRRASAEWRAYQRAWVSAKRREERIREYGSNINPRSRPYRCAYCGKLAMPQFRAHGLCQSCNRADYYALIEKPQAAGLRAHWELFYERVEE